MADDGDSNTPNLPQNRRRAVVVTVAYGNGESNPLSNIGWFDDDPLGGGVGFTTTHLDQAMEELANSGGNQTGGMASRVCQMAGGTPRAVDSCGGSPLSGLRTNQHNILGVNYR